MASWSDAAPALPSPQPRRRPRPSRSGARARGPGGAASPAASSGSRSRRAADRRRRPQRRRAAPERPARQAQRRADAPARRQAGLASQLSVAAASSRIQLDARRQFGLVNARSDRDDLRAPGAPGALSARRRQPPHPAAARDLRARVRRRVPARGLAAGGAGGVVRPARLEPAQRRGHDSGRARHDLRPRRRPARDRRAGDDDLRRSAPGDGSAQRGRGGREDHAPRPERGLHAAGRPQPRVRLRRAEGRLRRRRRSSARRGLPGLGFYHEERRIYPQVNLAAQVLGYAGVDNSGLAGLELSLDKQLAGRPGRERIVKDASGQAIDTITSRTERDGRGRLPDARPHDPGGRRRRSCCDTVREVACQERYRDRARPVATARCARWRSAPGFDANDYPKVWRELQRNRAVTDTYEPGSTFKLVTVAGALSEAARLADDALRPSVLDPRRRPRHPRRRAARDRDDERRADPLALLQRRRDHAGREARPAPPCRTGSRASASGKLTGIDFPGESQGIVLRGEELVRGRRSATSRSARGSPSTPIQMASAYARDREPRRVGAAAPRRPRRRRRLEEACSGAASSRPGWPRRSWRC